MAANGACLANVGCWSTFRWDVKSAAGGLMVKPIAVSARPSTVSSGEATALGAEGDGAVEKKREGKAASGMDAPEVERRSLKDYFEQSKDLIRSDGGPPRWFSPLECGTRLENSPLLLYLPGLCPHCLFLNIPFFFSWKLFRLRALTGLHFSILLGFMIYVNLKN